VQVVMALGLWGASSPAEEPGGVTGGKYADSIFDSRYLIADWEGCRSTIEENTPCRHPGTSLDLVQTSTRRAPGCAGSIFSFWEVAAPCHGLEESALPKRLGFLV